jgi:hypothetical protein
LSSISNASATFENCTFINTAPVDCNTGSVITFNTCVFTGNTNGALLCAAAQVTVSDCSFAGNGNNSSTSGGAINVNGGTCTIQKKSTFTGNSAYLGGAIYIAAVMCTITDSIIGNSINPNTAQGNGGGLHIMSGVICIIKNTEIKNNKLVGNFPSGGGGVYNDGKLEIIDCTISGNTTVNYTGSAGGGIYNDGILAVSNSIISGNICTGGGGGLYISSGNLNLIRGSITGNSTGSSGSQVNVLLGVSGSISGCNIDGTVRNYNPISSAIIL